MKLKDKVVISLTIISQKTCCQVFEDKDKTDTSYPHLNYSYILFSDIETKEQKYLADCEIIEEEKVFHIKDMEVSSYEYNYISGTTVNPDREESGTGSLIVYKGENYITQTPVKDVVNLMNGYSI